MTLTEGDTGVIALKLVGRRAITCTDTGFLPVWVARLVYRLYGAPCVLVGKLGLHKFSWNIGPNRDIMLSEIMLV